MTDATKFELLVIAGPTPPSRNGAVYRRIGLRIDGKDVDVVMVNVNSPVSRRRQAKRWEERYNINADVADEKFGKIAVAAAVDAESQRAEEAEAGTQNAEVAEESTPRKNQSTHLVDLFRGTDAELWHDPDGTAFVSIAVQSHRENWPLRSKAFKRWLARLFYLAFEKSAGSQATQDALAVLDGLAAHEGYEHKVFTRFAAVDDTIYLDLCDTAWRAVEITAKGVRVVDDPPVKFRRTNGMLPLPLPETGGNLGELRKFVNAPSDERFTPNDSQFILLVSWLVGALMPGTNFALLEVDGEQGSAKSTTCRVLRQLIDPHIADLRSQPHDDRDLMVSVTNCHMLAYDNLTNLPKWLSNGLCRVSTGGGLTTRALYTDSDETVFSGTRPILINSIGGIATESDLLDRAVRIMLPAITEDRRRDERGFWREFEKARPRIFGALLAAASCALRRRDGVKLKRKPRMIDFATWIVAAEEILPWEAGAFLTAYMGNRASAHDTAIEGSVVVSVLRAWMDRSSNPWSGTARELLDTLTSLVGEQKAKRREWPQSPRAMSGELRRLAPNLRSVGITVELDGRKKDRSRARIIELERVRKTPSTPSTSSAATKNSSDEPETANFADETADGDVDGRNANADGRECAASAENPVFDRENAVADGADGRNAEIPTHSNCPGSDDSGNALYIPGDWNPESWAEELEHRANLAKDDRPDVAADFTAKAKLIREQLATASSPITSAGSQSTDDDDELAPGEQWSPKPGVVVYERKD